MAIGGGLLGELLQLLGHSVHGVDPPPVGSENGVDDSRSINHLGFEGDDELQMSIVGERSINFRGRRHEPKVADLDGGKDVGGSREDLRLEIESTIVPRKRELVSPHSLKGVRFEKAR